MPAALPVARLDDAGPVRRPLVRALRERWERERVRLALWRLAYLLVLTGLTVASRVDVPYWTPIAAWIVAGSAAWVGALVAERDRTRQIRRHERSPYPAIGGWRLVALPADLDADTLLELDLLAWLYDRARPARRAIRGHPRGGGRVTYEGGGLRALARRWAAERGMPVRAGDRVLGRLEGHGAVYRVRISQVRAYRLVYPTVEDAIKAVERSTGRAMISWALGRDVRARP